MIAKWLLVLPVGMVISTWSHADTPAQSEQPPFPPAQAIHRTIVEIARGLDEEVGSLNGGFVYYLVDKWAVSNDVIQRKIADGSTREIIDGNAVAVIPSGPYAGYLTVERHYYPTDANGKTFAEDCLFIVRPDGKETFPVSDQRARDPAISQLVSEWPDDLGSDCSGHNAPASPESDQTAKITDPAKVSSTESKPEPMTKEEADALYAAAHSPIWSPPPSHPPAVDWFIHH